MCTRGVFSGACKPSSLTNRVVCVVAPTPRSKANRVLKTAIPPVNTKSLPGSVEELDILVQGTKAQSTQADAFAALEAQGHTTVTRAMPERGSHGSTSTVDNDRLTREP